MILTVPGGRSVQQRNGIVPMTSLSSQSKESPGDYALTVKIWERAREESDIGSQAPHIMRTALPQLLHTPLHSGIELDSRTAP
jgi:hypothetical protein